MKITTFNPQIMTNNPEPVMELFQELGFEKRHDKKDIGELKVEGIRMKDANGYALDISIPPISLPKDLIAIRVNVDDFDEAYELLLSQGFTNPRGDKVTETASSKATMLFAPSGFPVNIAQHIKKEK